MPKLTRHARAATIVWLRLDLRLADNPALAAAARRGGPVVPVFIWAPEEEGAWPPGAASRWWLAQSLRSLDARLRARGSRLVVQRGPSTAALRRLVATCGADTVVWSRRYEPALVARDAAVARALERDGVRVETFNSALLFEPHAITTRTGGPFQVFTPFWRACGSAALPPPPRPAPRRLAAPHRWPPSLTVERLGLEPAVDWAAGMRRTWTPGEAGAQRRLAAFVAGAVTRYPEGRDHPDRPGTSRLSPHLHFGEIGPRQVRRALGRLHDRSGADEEGALACERELGWREFAHHVLAHAPHTPDRPLRPAYARFPWRRNARALRAWQRGATGYPLVDAGMRELWTTGWMHNRTRMVVASFLVKHLLLDWRAGARWFWDTLVDADLASNTLGWQWAAGCGADAAPYFRIFNPTTQGERFDTSRAYVRRWVPEIADLPDALVYRPWDAPAQDAAAGYPPPVVEHAAARARALAALQAIR